MTLEEARVTANGVDFAYLATGPADGPLALCLHGFPDSAWTWRHLLPRLAEAGYRAVAPWMRGYAPTAVPSDGRYQTGALVADGNALHEALGGDGRAVLVGHDWGAVAAYGIASHAPDRWRRVVAIAVPPANVVGAAFVTSYDQLRRSWYMFFFQNPLSDLVVGSPGVGFVEHLWRDWSPGYADNAFDVARTLEAIPAGPNLAAALGYYRATFDPSGNDPALAAEQAAAGQIPPQALLYLHGADDGCMGADLAAMVDPAGLATGSRVEVVPGVGHFLHVEDPDGVNDRIVRFLEG